MLASYGSLTVHYAHDMTFDLTPPMLLKASTVLQGAIVFACRWFGGILFSACYRCYWENLLDLSSTHFLDVSSSRNRDLSIFSISFPSPFVLIFGGWPDVMIVALVCLLDFVVHMGGQVVRIDGISF